MMIINIFYYCANLFELKGYETVQYVQYYSNKFMVFYSLDNFIVFCYDNFIFFKLTFM